MSSANQICTLTAALLLASLQLRLPSLAWAECPAASESDRELSAPLANLFSEWTSTRSRQLLAQRNQTLEKRSKPTTGNCTSVSTTKPPGEEEEEEEARRRAAEEAELAQFQLLVREHRMNIKNITQDDDITRIMFRMREPRWMDACYQRPDLNDTVVVLEQDDHPGPHSPWVLEQDRRERGQFIRQVAVRRGLTLSPLAQKELDYLEAETRRKDAVKAASKAKATATTPSMAQLSTTLKPATPLARQKRSLGAGMGEIYLAKGAGLDKKNTLMFKQLAAGGSLSKSKKTSFIVSELAHRPRVKYRPAKGRYFVRPDEAMLATPAKPLPAQQQQRQLSEQVKSVVAELFQLDVKISHFITNALNTLNHTRAKVVLLLNDIQRVANSIGAMEIGAEQIRQVELGNRKWFPQFNELIRRLDAGGASQPSVDLYKITGSLYDPSQRLLWLNLTHYLELFSVAIEQMKYDLSNLDDTRAAQRVDEQLYQVVERLLMRMSCELQITLQLNDDFQTKRKEFRRLLEAQQEQPSNLGNLGQFYTRLADNQLSRDAKQAASVEFESPIGRAFARLTRAEQARLIEKMATYSPEVKRQLEDEHRGGRNGTSELPMRPPAHIWREIMPLEQRQIYDPRARAIRNLAIFRNLEPALKGLESILLSNFS